MLAHQLQRALLVGQPDLHLPGGACRRAPAGGDLFHRKLPDRRRLVAAQRRQVQPRRAVRRRRHIVPKIGEAQQRQFLQHPVRRDLQPRRALGHRRLDGGLHPRLVLDPMHIARRPPGRIARPDRRMRRVHMYQKLANEHPLARAELAAWGHGVPLLVGLELMQESSRPARRESGTQPPFMRRRKSPATFLSGLVTASLRNRADFVACLPTRTGHRPCVAIKSENSQKRTFYGPRSRPQGYGRIAG